MHVAMWGQFDIHGISTCKWPLPNCCGTGGVSIMVSRYVHHNDLIYHMKHRRAVDMLNTGLGHQSAIWHINHPSMLYKIHTVATYNC